MIQVGLTIAACMVVVVVGGQILAALAGWCGRAYIAWLEAQGKLK